MLRIDLQWKILVLFSIFSMVLCDWAPKKPDNQEVCKSQSCKDRGNEYRKNTMRSVHPCEDFYTFACGAWETNHPSPPYVEWDVGGRMDQDTLAILKKLVEELPSRQTDEQMAKLKLVYDTCMQIPFFNKHEPKEIKQQIEKIGRYPAKKLWDLHNEYLKVSGESALFDIDVGAFDNKIDLPMLQFSAPLSAYGSIFHELKWKPAEELSYVEALTEMLSSVNLSDSKEVVQKRIASVVQFRRKLNTILALTVQGDADPRPMQVKPSKLEEEFAQFVLPKHRNKYIVAIPWQQIAKILFHKLSTSVITTKNILIFHKVEFFKKLANLLAACTEQEIADHMEIYFIERHLKRSQQVKQLLKNSWKDPPAEARSVRFDEPRWMTCIKESDMGSALSKLLINKWFKVEYKDQVKTIMDGVKAMIKEQVSESKWLTDEGKVLTFERLDEVEDLIGEPTKRRETYSPLKSIFPTAFLDIEQDVMFVHAAMLQSPIYDPSLPLLYNLGTTGFMLGHEFYHVIDDCGSHRVSHSRTFNLWPEKMRNKCKDRKQCFIKEYNKFTQREFKRKYKLSPKVDTTYSFVENYPDVMGLKAAYLFHSKLLKGNRGKCLVLPGFEDYSCDQMFFLTFANMFCGLPPAKKALADLESDFHSINPVRINGAVSSTKAFANAFQCGRFDTMNPITKCNLWK